LSIVGSLCIGVSKGQAGPRAIRRAAANRVSCDGDETKRR
jgi:hypothetical protein